MSGEITDLFQAVPGLLRHTGVVESDAVQTDDGVHRRPDLMAHIGQERRLRLIGFFCLSQSLVECLVPIQCFPGLFIYVGESHAYRVDEIILPVFRVTDPRHPKEFIGFHPVIFHQIPAGDDQILL